jgi:hypothetical protein
VMITGCELSNTCGSYCGSFGGNAIGFCRIRMWANPGASIPVTQIRVKNLSVLGKRG